MTSNGHGDLYKVLGPNLQPHHGGNGKWIVGKPRSVKGDLVPCRNGLHAVTLQQLPGWLGPCVHPVTDQSDEFVDGGDKLVFRSLTIGPALDTWNERTARLFAADCADRALRRAAKRTGQKSDPRSRAAVRAARDYADGKITPGELDAARDAAWAAARAAAWAAAWGDAAWAAAGAAARDAAWAAARDAAWDAARDAAWAAERKWQAKRLGEYLRGERP